MTDQPTAKIDKEALALQRKLAKEREAFIERRRGDGYVADLRDDTVSLILGGRPSSQAHEIFMQIQAKGGPTAKTLENWLFKEVKRPQAPTLRAALNCVGYDLGIVEGTYRRLTK